MSQPEIVSACYTADAQDRDFGASQARALNHARFWLGVIYAVLSLPVAIAFHKQAMRFPLYWALLTYNPIRPLSLAALATLYEHRILAVLVARVAEFVHLSPEMAIDAIDLFSLWAIPWAFRWLLEGYISRLNSTLLAPIILLPMWANEQAPLGIQRTSDMVALLLAIIGFKLILSGNWRLYYPVFALALINDERSAFLILCVLLSQWKRATRREIGATMVIQTLIWSLVFIATTLIFGGKISAPFTILSSNINDFLMISFSPATYSYLLTWLIFGLCAPAVCLWKNKPELIRRLVWLVPISFIGMLFFDPDFAELHVWPPVLVVITLLAALTGHELLVNMQNADDLQARASEGSCHAKS